MRRAAQLLVLTLGLAGVDLAAQQTPAGARSARDLRSLLPEQTIALVELHDAAATAGLLQDWVRGLGPRAGLAVAALPLWIRAQTGHDPQELLQLLGPGQVLLAGCLLKGRVEGLLLSRVEEESLVRRALQKLPASIPWRIEAGVLRVAQVATLLRTEAAAGRAAKFHSVMPLARGRGMRAWLDLAAVSRGRGKPLYPQLPAGGTFFLGPVAKALDRAQRLDACLEFREERLQIRARVDAPMADRKLAVGRLLGHGQHERVVPPEPEGTIASLSIDRDPRAFFNQLEALMPGPKGVAAKTFVSNIDNLLGRFSLLEDLLPALRFPGALFVTETRLEADEEQPLLQLPAFSLVLPTEPQGERAAQRSLGLAFTAMSLITTATRAQQKQLPTGLRLRSRKVDGYRLKSLVYDPWLGDGPPPTEVGVTPSLLFAHGHLILSSTADGALRAARALAAGTPGRARGDVLQVDGAAAAAVLRKNLDLLVLERILKEGDTPAESRRFFATLLEILHRLSLDAALQPGAEHTQLQLSLRRTR